MKDQKGLQFYGNYPDLFFYIRSGEELFNHALLNLSTFFLQQPSNEMKNAIKSILFAILFSTTSPTIAQSISIAEPIDSTKTYKLELNDGTNLIGNFLRKDANSATLKTSSIPRIEIPISKIKSIEKVEDASIKKEKNWFPNPNATRYFYGPSAFNLKRGKGYYKNTFVFLNSVDYGITDNISIGGGLELVSTVLSTFLDTKPLFFLTPKVGFKVTEKFHAGGGLLYLHIPTMFGSGGSTNLGIAYGCGTIGTTDHNITGGLGWGFVNGELSKTPIVTLSGMTRISKRVALVSENWLVPFNSYYGLYSYGIRFFAENMAVDLAFVNNAEIAGTIPIGIPFLTYSLNF